MCQEPGVTYSVSPQCHCHLRGSPFLQRVRPMDVEVPSLVCEHTIFSLREDRMVKYEIMAQTLVDSTWQVFRTDQVTQTFQFCKSACKSQVRACLSSLLRFCSFCPALLFGDRWLPIARAPWENFAQLLKDDLRSKEC